MDILNRHIIFHHESVKDALKKLDVLASDAILFVVDDQKRLIGSLTDGDLRRGFIRGLDFTSDIMAFIQKNPIFIKRREYNLAQLEEYKSKHFKIIPIVNAEHVIVDILNFRIQKTIIPASAVLMAGGIGKRLMPLTAKTPKPMLMVGDKPIIEYNVDQLLKVGIRNLTFSINYLGNQIEEYFGDGKTRHANFKYIRETKPLGTIGSILLIDSFEHEDILVINSDLLTNIDFADFYLSFKNSGAAMAVATTSYAVDVPYAVLEVDDENLATSFKEKPRYTYYSNAGIYFFKKSIFNLIPSDTFYDVTDLMEAVIAGDGKILTYPITGYWLDIGKHEDFKKAQEDVKHINFN